MNALSIILFAGAVLFFALGIALYRGNAKLIHDYHQKNVKESEKRAYARAMSKGLFSICATLLLSGVIAWRSKDGAVLASVAVLLAGLFVSVVILVRAQNKYNGGLF